MFIFCGGGGRALDDITQALFDDVECVCCLALLDDDLTCTTDHTFSKTLVLAQ